MINSRIEIEGTLKVDLGDHPFKAGEGLWEYAERALKEAGLEGVSLANIEPRVDRVEITTVGSQVRTYAPTRSSATIWFKVPPDMVVKRDE